MVRNPNHLSSLVASKLTTLSNGLRIASENLDMKTATVGVWIGSGSRYENELNNGSAHFLEHMSFKGTKNRTKTALAMEIENMGGHLNAYTSREQTVYYAKVFKENIPNFVEILSDILLNSTLDNAAIEAERDVILREQEEVDKQIEEVIFDYLHGCAFQGTPLARTILGSKKNIQTLTKNDLTNYIKNNYTANRMVLAAAGGVDHDNLVLLAEKYFKNLPSSSASSPTNNYKIEKSVYTGSEVRMRDDTMENAHIVLAVEGSSWTNADYYPLLVLQAMVGSWDRSLSSSGNSASRLAQAVATNSLAHKFVSFNTSYSDTGLFGIYMCSDRKYGLDDLIFEVQREWMRICLSPSPNEVQRAIKQVKASLLLSLDGSTPICENLGLQHLTLNRKMEVNEVCKELDSIDANRIKSVAMKYIYDKCPVIAAFGPIESLPDYNRIRADIEPQNLKAMVPTLSMKYSISDVNLKGKRVLIRVDFNVPFNKSQISNLQRIQEAIPTINYALENGASRVILMSHLGRPDGIPTEKYSLKPVAEKLQELLAKPVTFINDCVGVKDKINGLSSDKQVILLENLRFHLEEEGSVKRDNEKISAKLEDIEKFRHELSSLGDVYVNDAFGTMHRPHSSIVGINLPIRAAGFLVKKELDFFSKIIDSPNKEVDLAIVGGAKVSDKILLIENLLSKVKALMIGGGMVFTFLSVLQSMKIGKSLYDENGAHLISKIMKKAKEEHVDIYFPVDFVIADAFSNDCNTKIVTVHEGIPNEWMGLDIGPESCKKFKDIVIKSKMTLWNGPMGVFEFAKFEAGTKAILDAMVVATKNDSVTIVGGGDSAAAVFKWNAQDSISHVSTGGGASLELLEGKSLPGVEALKSK